MSIETKLKKKESMIAKLDDRKSKILDYLHSDKVKNLFSRCLASANEESCLIEKNDNFRLYLTRQALELYEYRRIEVTNRMTEIPILRSIFKQVFTVTDLSYEPVFSLEFNEDGSYEIDRLVPSLTTDELIEALDELLFTK